MFESMFFLILLVMVFAGISQMVRIVPQGEEWVVERMGKYNTTLMPGLNILVPIIDAVRYKLSTKELLLPASNQEIVTKDNAVAVVSATIFYKITDVYRASYAVESYEHAVLNMAQATLRSVVGGMDLNSILNGRDIIKAQVGEKIGEHMQGWGLALSAVEIQDIRPSESLQRAMEKQAAAEREKQASILTAEGQKQASILEAQGKLESAKLEAEAKIALANGDSQAMESISAQMKASEGVAANYLLAQRYVDSIKELAQSDNAKVVFVPADLKHSLEGAVGGLAQIVK